VHVREEHSVVARCGYRANPERRADKPAIDERRSCVPFISPRNGIKPGKLLERAVRSDAQNVRVVGPDVDCVADSYAA
jgi:hypothetical protein